MHILPVYAALLALLFVFLSLRTIGVRRRLQIALGGAEHPEMLRAVRVHGNFAEYVPLALIVVGMVEWQHGPAWLVHALGALLLVGRSVHAWGMSRVNEAFVFRVSGMVMTFNVLLIAALSLLLHAAGVWPWA